MTDVLQMSVVVGFDADVTAQDAAFIFGKKEVCPDICRKE